MKPDTNDDVPFASNPSALSKDERVRFSALTNRLIADKQEAKELPDGYALRFAANPQNIKYAAEYIIGRIVGDFAGRIGNFAGFVLEGEFEKTSWLKIAGVVTMLIGTYILTQPLIGFPSLATLIGIFQIVRGIINALLAYDLKRNQKLLEAEL